MSVGTHVAVLNTFSWLSKLLSKSKYIETNTIAVFT